MIVTLKDYEVAAIRGADKEGGGFQELLRDMDSHLSGNQLTVDGHLRERIFRYSEEYGEGGWQELLRPIADRIRSAR